MIRLLKRIVKPIVRASKRTPSQIPVYVSMLQSEFLKGRITGGSRGIGFAIAEAFLSAGATVVIAGRNNETVSKAVEQLRPRGANKRYCNGCHKNWAG